MDSEILHNALVTMIKEVEERDLHDLVSITAAAPFIRIELRREGRALWLGHEMGRGYFLVSNPDHPPTAYFELATEMITSLLPVANATAPEFREPGSRLGSPVRASLKLFFWYSESSPVDQWLF